MAGKGGKGGGDDWRCLACGASCFASKPACFKCGAPRPQAAAGAGGDAPSDSDDSGGSGRLRMDRRNVFAEEDALRMERKRKYLKLARRRAAEEAEAAAAAAAAAAAEAPERDDDAQEEGGENVAALVAEAASAGAASEEVRQLHRQFRQVAAALKDEKALALRRAAVRQLAAQTGSSPIDDATARRWIEAKAPDAAAKQKALEAAKAARPPERVTELAANDTIMVKQTVQYYFAENPKKNYSLQPGLKGKVLAVNAKGDAKVQFERPPIGNDVGKRWVLKKDFRSSIAILVSAKTQEEQDAERKRKREEAEKEQTTTWRNATDQNTGGDLAKYLRSQMDESEC